MFNAFIILVGITAMVLSTVVATVVAFWLVNKAMEYIFGK